MHKMDVRRSIYNSCREYLNKLIDCESCKHIPWNASSINPFDFHVSVRNRLRTFASHVHKKDSLFTKELPNCGISADEVRRWSIADLLAFRKAHSIALPVELSQSELPCSSAIDRCARCVASGIAPGCFYGRDPGFAPNEASSLGVWNGAKPIFDASDEDKAKIAKGKAKFVFLSLDDIAVDMRGHTAVLHRQHALHGPDGLLHSCQPENSKKLTQSVYNRLPDALLKRIVSTPRFSTLSILFHHAYNIDALIQWQNEDPDIYFVIIDHLRWFDFYAFRDLLLYPLRVVGTIGGYPGIVGIASWRDKFLHHQFSLDSSKFVIIDAQEPIHFRRRFSEFYDQKDHEENGTCIPLSLIPVVEGQLTTQIMDCIKNRLEKCSFSNSKEALKKSPIYSSIRHRVPDLRSFWIEVGYTMRISSDETREVFKEYYRTRRNISLGIP